MTKELPNSSTSAIEEEDIRTKIPRIRSSAYPSYTIDFCTEFTKRLHQQFGNSAFSQREEIAKVMKISVGHIQTQLSSSVQYGLIEMKVRVGYKPSDHFLRVYKPINDDERREALLSCLLKPELYYRLIMQFKGGVVPSISGLSTILFRNHNIAEAASEGAAKVFIENLQNLNLLDSDNYLLLDKDFGNEKEGEPQVLENETNLIKQFLYYPEKSPQIELMKKPVETAIIDQPQTYPIPIPLKGGRVAKLVIPEGFTNEDLDKITRFIEALRE